MHKASWCISFFLSGLFKLTVPEPCEDSQRPHGILGATQRIVWVHGLWCYFDLFPSVQSEIEESPRKSESGCHFSFLSITNTLNLQREEGKGRQMEKTAWRDISGPHISFATSDFQIKWAQSADHNEIFLIDFPESVAGSANQVTGTLHHHQPSPISGMLELGRCWQICHWCMRPGKIQCLLAWQCWPGLSINEE